jgi:hypothetical protein
LSIGQFIKNAFLRIFGKPSAEYPVILGCILIAAAIWLLTALNKEYTTSIAYPVVFKYDKLRLIPVDDLPSKLEVNVTGPGWSLLKRTFGVNQKSVSVYTNNYPRKKYLGSGDLLPIFIAQLPELKVNFVVSDSILINMNRIISRKIGIKVDTSLIKLAEGYSIAEPAYIKPDSILITGASTLVNSFPSFMLLELPIKNLSDDFEEAVDIDYKKYNYLKFSNKKILVGLKVGKYVNPKIEVPITFLNIPEGYEVPNRTSASLSIKIKESDLDSLKNHTIKVLVDFNKMRGKSIYLNVRNLPIGAYLSQIEPLYFVPNEK